MAQVMQAPVPNPSGLAPRSYAGERRKPLSCSPQPIISWILSLFFVDWWSSITYNRHEASYCPFRTRQSFRSKGLTGHR